MKNHWSINLIDLENVKRIKFKQNWFQSSQQEIVQSLIFSILFQFTELSVIIIDEDCRWHCVYLSDCQVVT
jgi:hypothetical protein